MPRPYFHDKSRHIDEILRVDHAGEYGAIRIYEGQLSSLSSSSGSTRGPINRKWVLGSWPEDDDVCLTIHHMLSQEQKHLEYFESEILKHNSRPTLLLPIWNILGFALGYLSAIAGSKMAMLTTEAVEEVIDEHYKEQYDLVLAIGSKDLASKIEEHRIEELHHKNIAIEHGSQQAMFYPYFKMAIGKLTKFAIFASKII